MAKTIETAKIIVTNALISGLKPRRAMPHSRSGKVVASPYKNTEINVSSNDNVMASIAPVSTAELKCGHKT